MPFWTTCPKCKHHYQVNTNPEKRRNFTRLIEVAEKKVGFSAVHNVERLKKYINERGRYSKAKYYDVVKLAHEHPDEVDKAIDIWLDNNVYIVRGLNYLLGIIQNLIRKKRGKNHRG